MIAAALTLSAFWRTHQRARRLRTRDAVLRWQARRLERFLRTAAPHAPAFAGLKGRPLSDFPVMDKSILMGAFEAYNCAGITAASAWDAFAGNGRIGRHTIGASTGTSGNRGLYLISETERYLWLGTLLAKALPDILQQRYRVAVMLPSASRLYDAANETGRLALKFFDLRDGVEPQMEQLARFQPNVLVAPPHALLALARADLPLQPLHVFSGAEVLEQQDREALEARFGVTVREIYMATEGLFGVSCPHGTLHLCEDCVAFEWEREGNLAKPVITDFTRRTQVMIRYRMNDLLRLSVAPCPCGSPLQAVSEVAGRMDDCFFINDREGRPLTVTPDVLRNAVLGASRTITDFRLVQEGPQAVRLSLPPGQADDLPAAEAAVTALLTRLNITATLTPVAEPLTLPHGAKLRRVSRLGTATP